MHARSTGISGDPGSVDAGITYVRDEVMPAITAMAGCVGLSLLVDRDSGRLIATSSWHDPESLHASDEPLAPMRARGAEILSGTVEVEEWEVEAMHRDHATHDGSCCRVTWARVPDVDGFVVGWREQVLPRLEQEMAGFCSASLLVDRSAGRACGTVGFDSRDDLVATREQAAAMRGLASKELGIEILDHAEFDLVIAHLRVPEMV